MSSLSNCLSVHKIPTTEAEFIKSKSAEYRSEGFDAQAANEGAVKDLINNLRGEYEAMVAQVQGKATKPTDNVVDAEEALKDPELAKFKGNKFFTAAVVKGARDRIAASSKTLSSGFDITLLKDLILIGGAYFEKGAREFTAWAKKMRETHKDVSEKYLVDTFKIVSKHPAFDGETRKAGSHIDWQPEVAGTGRIFGSPEDINTMEDFENKLKFVTGLRDEGVSGRYWYEQSARYIWEAMQGNPLLAEKFIKILAIYSPQSAVGSNTTMGIKAFNQWLNGVPEPMLKTKTTAQDAKARNVLYHDGHFEGRKTESFYYNLLTQIIYEHPEAIVEMTLSAEDMEKLGIKSTVDVWMLRSFHYRRAGTPNDLGNGAYSFVENSLLRLVDEANANLPEGEPKWTPYQYQAAVWTAMKARYEDPAVKAKTNQMSLDAGFSYMGTDKKGNPALLRKTDKVSKEGHMEIWYQNAMSMVTPEQARNNAEEWGADFATHLTKRTAVATWEANPSTVFKHEINDASRAIKEEFQSMAQQIITGEEGENLVSSALGIGLTYDKKGSGAYAGTVSPNTLSHLTPTVSPLSKHTVNAYTKILQYVFKQDAVPWFQVNPQALNKGEANENKYRVIDKNDKTYRTFPTIAEARAVAAEKGSGYAVKGGPYARGMMLTYGSDITPEQEAALSVALDAKFGNGGGFTRLNNRQVAVVNFRDDDTKIPEMEDEDFIEGLRDITDDITGIESQKGFWAEGRYGYHDWTKDKEGKALTDDRIITGIPGLLNRVRAWRAEYEELVTEFSGEALRERERQVAAGRGRFRIEDAGKGIQTESGLPVNPDGTVPLFHWSAKSDLTELDPGKYGTGIKGAELRRKQNDPANWVNRTYYGVEGGGYTKEPGLGGQRYDTSIPFMRLYDFQKDPDNLMDAVRKEKAGDPFINQANLYERKIKEAGYAGYISKSDMGYVAAVFEKQPVSRRAITTWPSDISNAKAFYSKIQQVASDKFTGMKAQGVENFLLKQGVKKAEIESTGLREWLGAMKPTDKVTKEQLSDFVQANTVEFEDVVMGARDQAKVAPIAKKLRAVVKANDDLGYDTTGEAVSDLRDNKLDPNNVEWNDAEDKELAIDLIRKLRDAIGWPTHFDQYTEPGAEEGSYREMFVTAPGNKVDESGWEVKYIELNAEVKRKLKERGIDRSGGYRVIDTNGHPISLSIRQTKEEALADARKVRRTWNDGHSQYSEIQNPIVRIRFNTVKDSEGRTILRVEEMQGPSDANQQKMPKHLKDNIYQTGVKRVLAYAKENGFDGVALATKPGRTAGETQADRYSLEKQIREINYTRHDDFGEITYDFSATGLDGNEAMQRNGLSQNEVADYLGKDMAVKMDKKDGTFVEGGDDSHYQLSGLDLRVGGSGLKQLYDVDLPNIFKAWGKEAIGEAAVATSQSSWEVVGYDIEGSRHVLSSHDNKSDADRAAKDTGKYEDSPVSVERGGTATMPFIPITQNTPSTFPKFRRGTVAASADSETARVNHISSLPVRQQEIVKHLERSGVLNFVTNDRILKMIKQRDGVDFASQNVRIAGVVWDGPAFIAAENIPADQIWSTIRHEVGVHVGFLLQSDKEFQMMKDSVWGRRDEKSTTGEAIRAAMKLIPADTESQYYREEIIAYLAGQEGDIGIIRRLITKVKMAMVKAGFDMKLFTVDDFKAMADMAIKASSKEWMVAKNADGSSRNMVTVAAQPARHAQVPMGRAAAPHTGPILPIQTVLEKSWLGEKFEKFGIWGWNADKAIETVQKQIPDQPVERDYNLLRGLAGKAIAGQVQIFDSEKLQPYLKSLVANGLTIDDVERLGWAQHAPERNLQMRRVNARRYVDAVIGFMTGTEAKPYEDQLGDIQEEFIMQGQTLNEKRDQNVAMMDQMIGEIPIWTAAIEQMQRDLDARVFTPQEVSKGTPDWFQAKIDKRWEDLAERKRLIDQWEAEKGMLSGMTDSEAAAIIQEYNGNASAFDATAEIRGWSDEALDRMFRAGEFDPEEYINLKRMYQYYVPLMREDQDNAGLAQGRKGLGPISRPFKTAAGSTRKVVDIFANVVDRWQGSVAREQKLIAGRALYDMIRANPNEEMWAIVPLKKSPYEDNEGNIRYYTDQRLDDKTQTYVKVDGKKYVIQINKNSPTMVRFMEAINRQVTQMGPVYQALGSVNRVLARLYTSWTPEFMLPNFARDIQTAMVNMTATEAKGLQTTVLKNVGKAIRGIWLEERGKPSGVYGAAYKEARMTGGLMGWMTNYEDVKELSKELKMDFETAQGQHWTRHKLEAIGKYVNDLNMAIENGVRVATYKAMVDRGIDKRIAAQTVSNLTVDFTKHGTAGPAINSLFIFANAAIQGTVRGGQALLTSHKVQGVAASIVGFGMMMNFLGGWMGGEDEDGEEFYEKMKREQPDLFQRNIVIMQPGGGGKHFKIPMAYFWNTFYTLGDEAASAMKTGRWGEGSVRVVTALMNSFNPLAASSALQMVTPTIGDPLAQVAENKAWHGGPLMPKENPFGYKADSWRHWKNVNPTVKETMQWLNDVTGGSQFKSGWIDISPETIEMLIGTYGGGAGKFIADTMSLPINAATGELTPRNTPLVRKIYGTMSDSVNIGIFYENREDLEIFEQELKVATPAERRAMIKDPLYKLLGPYKQLESSLRVLTKQKKALVEKGQDTDVIDKRISKLQVEFNAKYNKATGR